MAPVALSAMREAQSQVIVYGLHMPDTGGVERLNRRDSLPAQPGHESAGGDSDVVRKEHRCDQGEQKAYPSGFHIDHRTTLGAWTPVRRWSLVNVAMLTPTAH